MSEDPYALKTIEDLRRIIPTSKPQSEALRQRLNDYVDAFSAEFINDSPMVFVGTCSRDGHVDVSLKGDAPGFVVLRDTKTLLLPERVGNTEARGLSNLLEHKKISLLLGQVERFGQAGAHLHQDYCGGVLLSLRPGGQQVPSVETGEMAGAIRQIPDETDQCEKED